MQLADVESLANDLHSLADRLTAKSDSPKSFADPFAAHYFVARKAYRVAVQRSGQVGRAVLSTYQIAMKLGFKGSMQEWETLLKVCRA